MERMYLSSCMFSKLLNILLACVYESTRSDTHKKKILQEILRGN